MKVIHDLAKDSIVQSRLQSRQNGRSPLDNNPEELWGHAVSVTGYVAEVLGDIAIDNNRIYLLPFDNSEQDPNPETLEQVLRDELDRKYQHAR